MSQSSHHDSPGTVPKRRHRLLTSYSGTPWGPRIVVPATSDPYYLTYPRSWNGSSTESPWPPCSSPPFLPLLLSEAEQRNSQLPLVTLSLKRKHSLLCLLPVPLVTATTHLLSAIPSRCYRQSWGPSVLPETVGQSHQGWALVATQRERPGPNNFLKTFSALRAIAALHSQPSPRVGSPVDRHVPHTLGEFIKAALKISKQLYKSTERCYWPPLPLRRYLCHLLGSQPELPPVSWETAKPEPGARITDCFRGLSSSVG